MATHRMTDKEQALIDAARREAAGKRAPRPAVALPAGATTPLDQPTVLGWDHPAAAEARPKVALASEKWEQVSAMMEAERRAETERRARLRQKALYVMLGLAVALLAFVLLTLRR
jgi:hypothetical protein